MTALYFPKKIMSLTCDVLVLETCLRRIGSRKIEQSAHVVCTRAHLKQIWDVIWLLRGCCDLPTILLSTWHSFDDLSEVEEAPFLAQIAPTSSLAVPYDLGSRKRSGTKSIDFSSCPASCVLTFTTLVDDINGKLSSSSSVWTMTLFAQTVPTSCSAPPH